MNLPKDLLDWAEAETKRQKATKAMRVMTKCLLRGHNDLAKKIGRKYQKDFPKSDLAMSFGMLLNAITNIR